MAEQFQTCPGCESLILSDTPACPECGHKFHADAAIPVAHTHERGETLHQTCPQCGDEIPAGLVRCWSCNSFMRKDVAEKYQALVDNPQPIIFSDVSPDERTETIPPRAGGIGYGGYARINDDGEAEFVLAGEDAEGDEFELNAASEGGGASAGPTAVPEQAPAETVEAATSADESESVTSAEPSSEEQPPEDELKAATSDNDKETAAGDDVVANTDNSESPAPPQADADSLLDIALTQEKEADVRKRERLAQMNRKRIMVPCPSCGVWLKVREEQYGKSVRCRKCKAVIPVPKIRRKASKGRKQEEPQIAVDWVEDVHLHLIVPTDIALKPASLKDVFETADVAFHTDGLHFVRMGGAPRKKSLFSRAATEDFSTQRAENRAQLQKSGNFKSLKHGETHSVPVENLPAIRLVQPIRKAHESMFAGVSVFGEGRIAFYLPLKLDDDKQVFCSMPLSQWRVFSQLLHSNFEVELPAKDNGVPDREMHSSPPCHYSQNKVEALRNVEYYEHDEAYELELTGYRCVACSVAVSEDARAKNKLGGSAGKSIARAKCPACSAKFGREPLYRITKAPESAEDEEVATG